MSFCGPQGFGPFSRRTIFDLTPCFEDVILSIMIVLSFVVFLSVSASIPDSIPLKSRVLRKSVKITTAITFFRFLCSFLLLSLNLLLFGYLSYYNVKGSKIFFQGSYSVPPFSSIVASGFAVALSAMNLYVSRFLIKDSISFLLTTICLMLWLFDLVRLRTMLYLSNYKSFRNLLETTTNSRRDNFPIYVMFGIIIFEFGLICLMGVPLHSWGTIPVTPSISAEQHASYLSRIFFFWAWPLLKTGSKGALEITDIYDLKEGMASGMLQKIYENSWATERIILERKERNFLSILAGGLISFFAGIFKIFSGAYNLLLMVINLPFNRSRVKHDNDDENEDEDEPKIDPEVRKIENAKSIFLVKVLFRSFGWEYLGAGVLRLGIILLTFLTPLLMTSLLEYIQFNGADAQAAGIPPQPRDLGISIVVSMLAIMILNLALSAMFTWISDMATYKARSALMTEIYRKSLRLKNPMNAGEVVNRFSSDTTAVTGAFAFLHLIWSAPIEIIVALILLFNILGFASFAALGTSVVIGLVSYLVVPYLVRKSEKMMAINDKRMNLVSGTFSFAQTVKMYGWEKLFAKKITDARNAQLHELAGVLMVSAFIGGLVSSAVSLIILSTLGIYAVTAPPDRPLDLARIFVAMSLLGALQSPLDTLSGAYSQILQLSVSFRRLAQILCADEIEDRDFTPPTPQSPFLISIRSGTFSTFSNSPETPSLQILHKINLDIPKGKLTAIVGPTGCGKTSLLGAISGGVFEMSPGGIMIKGNIKMGIVPQNPWIFNGTLRENILFYSEYDVDWYKTVIDACSLKTDFDCVKGKDMAHMVDGGNLSGGQKQRVALARALYSKETDVILFDDPLSAVDARVSAHIFENVMSNNGVLTNKTRVVTTNRLDLLPQFDHIIVMNNGTVIAQGPFNELMKNGNATVRSFLGSQFQQQSVQQRQRPASKHQISPISYSSSIILQRYGSYDKSSRISENNSKNPVGSYDTFSRRPEKNSSDHVESYDTFSRRSENNSGSLINRVGSFVQGKSTLDRRGGQGVHNQSLLRKRRPSHSQQETISRTLTRIQRVPEYQTSANIRATAFADVMQNEIVDDEEEDEKNREESEKYRVVQDEMQHRGRLPYNLYLYYIRNCSYFLIALVIFLLFANLGLDGFNQFWLMQWGETNVGTSSGSSQNMFFLGIFALGSIGAALLAIFLDLVAIRYMALAASKKMHEYALISTLAAPITFYHANPPGRIINRFSSDIMGLDRTIPQNILTLINSLLAGVLSTTLACIASPYVIAIVAVIGVLYWFLINFFMKTVRELRRLVLTSQSPTFQFLKESMDGISTIRGFGKEAQSQLKMQELINTNSKVFYSTFAASSWLSTNIQFLSMLLIIPVLILSVTSQNLDPGLLTIAISNSLSVSSTLQGIVQAYISMEISLVSIERIKEYIDRDPEDKYRYKEKSAVIPGPQWPSSGKIQFVDYSTSYSTEPDGPLVLKNLNLTFRAGERIAIVGRTGAGKSSIVLALFQLLNARSGSIYIDNIDIGSIPLEMIRTRMAIIPQQAMMYPGTVRENLDPAMIYSDKELWNSLRLVGLSPLVKTLPSTIEGKSSLDERFPGEKLSTGQMQLFCLCRAILLGSKIIVLDEPTSNLDIETDAMIQNLIRTIFEGCTVITIAHRIATILDYDAVLVMDNGEAKEFGHPRSLLSNPKSAFASLANGIQE